MDQQKYMDLKLGERGAIIVYNSLVPGTFLLAVYIRQVNEKKGLNPTENSILLIINIQLFNDHRAFVRRIFARCAKIYGVLARLHHEVVVVVVPYTHRMVRSDRVNRNGNFA